MMVKFGPKGYKGNKCLRDPWRRFRGWETGGREAAASEGSFADIFLS